MVSNATTLGPQCLSCKRRRVKCDSTKPACTRCRTDRIECPGYVKPRKWKNLSSNTAPPKNPRRKRLKTEARESDVEMPKLDLSISYTLPWLDKEPYVLFDSIQYYNAQIMPDIVPTYQSPSRPEFHLTQWQKMPTLLQRILIVIVRTTQAIKTSIDSTSKSDLYHYRGLVLSELKNSVTSVSSDREGTVLSCILLVMLADIQLSAIGSWSTHLEAARRIIRLRGGLGKCFNNFSRFSDLLIHYMTIDILSTTTCPNHLLDPEIVLLQAEYIQLLPLLEQQIVSNCCPCPQVLLQAVISTNILRATNFQSTSEFQPDAHATQAFEEILYTIQSFDASAWAETLPPKCSSSPRLLPALPDITNGPSSTASLPDTMAWTSLALCYKSAALLYLLLCFPTSSIAGSTTQPEKQHVNLIQHTQETLSQNLSFLFALSHTSTSASPSLIPPAALPPPLHTQLWKFVAWPLVISAYVHVCYDFPSTTDLDSTSTLTMPETETHLYMSMHKLENDGKNATVFEAIKEMGEPEVEEIVNQTNPEEQLALQLGIGEEIAKEIKRLETTSTKLGARSLSDAAGLLRGIIEERASVNKKRSSSDLSRSWNRGWKWDDGWKSRCSFVL